MVCTYTDRPHGTYVVHVVHTIYMGVYAYIPCVYVYVFMSMMMRDISVCHHDDYLSVMIVYDDSSTVSAQYEYSSIELISSSIKINYDSSVLMRVSVRDSLCRKGFLSGITDDHLSV